MAQSQMAFPLFSQTIITPKSSLPSLLLIPKNKHNRKPNTIIKAEAGYGDHLQRTNTKTQLQQQKQPIKKRLTQAPPIGLWDRFPTARTVQQMMDTMERLMDDPLSYNAINNGTWGPRGEGTSSYSRGRTPWEIKEGEHDYKVRFDMPGMTKEDVKVWVEEKMLVLNAEKVDKSNNNGESNGEAIDEGEWSAKSFGKYSFRIALPENIQFENIKAEARDGVLYVTIPKAPVSSKVLDINVQ